MLAEIVTHASILDSFGAQIKDRIFHPSGWSAPNDTDSGISFGEVLDVGVGYMRMDVQDDRTKTGYTLRGAYLEVGVGVGELVKSKAAASAAGKAIVSMMAKVSAKDFVKNSSKILKAISKLQSDLVFMPGGSITPFMMGPFMTRGSLELDDFKNATWCYIYLEGDLGIGANVGFMLMLDPDYLKYGEMAAPFTFGASLDVVLAMCKAWAPYWGLGVSLSADIKAVVRVIQDFQLVPLSSSWL